MQAGGWAGPNGPTHPHTSPVLFDVPLDPSPSMQRTKEGQPVTKAGKLVELTSHTLNPVPCALGGPGLPENVRFRCACALVHTCCGCCGCCALLCPAAVREGVCVHSRVCVCLPCLFCKNSARQGGWITDCQPYPIVETRRPPARRHLPPPCSSGWPPRRSGLANATSSLQMQAKRVFSPSLLQG